MKFTLSAIMACLAGVAIASPINGHSSNGEASIISREDNAVKANVKFLQATMANDYLVEQPIVGTPIEVNNFIDGLDFPELKQVLGDDYGYPFCLYFYDISSGSYLGSLCGHFNTEYQVIFDGNTQIPSGGRQPSIPASKQDAPQPVRVTASTSQSEQIIAAGEVSDDMLHELLGADYGKPFIIIIQGENSGGEADGSVDSSGKIVFDPSTSIPDATPPPAKPVTVYANEAQSEQIIQAGSVSDKLLHELLGQNYGKPFVIIIQGKNSGGEVDGTFNADGSVVFGPGTNIPDAPMQKTYNATEAQSNEIIQNGKISDAMLRDILGSNYGKTGTSYVILLQGSSSGGEIDFTFNADGTVQYSPATNIPKPQPTTGGSNPNAPAGSNTGSVSFNLTGTDLKNQLNNLSYDYILKATGGKYGKFYITFTSSDGKTKGYISGTIEANGAYSYQWATTTTS